MDENNNLNQEFKNVNSNRVDSTYREFKKSEKKNGAGFGKTVVLPFLCGALGSVIVIGTCVSVPEIKNTLLKQYAAA